MLSAFLDDSLCSYKNKIKMGVTIQSKFPGGSACIMKRLWTSMKNVIIM